MQIRKKRRIVIASLLKPVDDTRMFEKLGVSLAARSDAEIHIIGQPTVRALTTEKIAFHPLASFQRISWGRFFAPLKAAETLLKLKPDILIVNTPELLNVAVLFRIFFGTKIIYDIRENYAWNALYSGSFSPIAGKLVSWFLTLKQTLVAPFFHHFFLAEKCYGSELRFVPAHKATVLENKTIKPRVLMRTSSTEEHRLVFTGTLSTSTGVFRAIELARKLYQTDGKIRLHIIGYCALVDERKRIMNEARKYPFVQLTGIDRLVPHAEILEEISKAHAGIIAYEVTKATQHKIPTKLYEYLGYQLPIVLVNHTAWLGLCPPGTALNFENSSVEQILAFVTDPPQVSAPESVFWDQEEPRLFKIIDGLSSK